MLFNSLEFGVFIPIVFILYWFVFNKSVKLQNVFVLFASYVFYGWWDWRFLILIAVSSFVDFSVGQALNRTDDAQRRKYLLWVSLSVNLGLLGFFKYFNFFLDSFRTAFTFLGHSFDGPNLHIILPIGISFYTLQTLSYTIDVYRKNLKATNDIIAFFSFVSFFPQLVAGPIERATSLLPQMLSLRTFNEQAARDGTRQILWGLFKKIVIADNCAAYTYLLLIGDPGDTSGSTALLATCLGAIQFYCDFSGYSDIAIGTARLFGFKLMKNFAFPFFSRDIAEFWTRWHISLISWIKDYVVKSIGGITRKTAVRNIFIVFILTGLWHGAKWSFILWGFLQFLFFLPYLLRRKRVRKGRIVAKDKYLPSIKEVYQMISTFLLFALSGLLFFTESISKAIEIFLHIVLNKSTLTIPEIPSRTVMLSILILLIVEWLQREKEHGLEHIERLVPRPVRWISYYLLIGAIAYYGGDQQPFIYFQF
ncbi:UNVERIFIED_CONTAM: hypothetical protein GTU68_059919 [Idotea baltica]|nr:hypothetical protein [Idotea baltica]